MEEKYNQYDQVVNTVMSNILVERNRCGKILLYDFNPVDHADRLYFNIAAIVADLNKECIYINMPIAEYIKFKWARRKTRKNLRYFGKRQANKLDNEYKTSIYVIMDFISKHLGIDYSFFKEVNDAYYGWLEE